MSKKNIVLVGLGNPGDVYKNTRHNVGRSLLFNLADVFSVKFEKTKSFGFVGSFFYQDTEVFFHYSSDYMNLSGKDLSSLVNYYKINLKNVCVFHDELEKKSGSLICKFSGSARGHNGLKNIISLLGFDFWRLGIGIDHPQKIGLHTDVSDYVLGGFKKDELLKINNAIDKVLLHQDLILNGCFEELKNILEKK